MAEKMDVDDAKPTAQVRREIVQLKGNDSPLAAAVAEVNGETGLLCLDVTNQPGGDLPILNPEIQELIMTNNRLTEVPEALRPLQLQIFNARQNQLKTFGPVLGTQTALTHLDLYDNEVKSMLGLEALTELTKLDISFNKFRAIEGLDTLGNLRELYFVQNKITAIGNGLAALTNLTTLELGANRIREIEGLSTLVNLKDLWLGKNKIREIKNIECLSNLQRLSVQSNRLTSISGLSSNTTLTELYISHNGITEMEGLETLTNLQTLDLAGNPITKIECCQLPKLEEFWCNDCQLDDWDSVKLLTASTNIQTVYFERNPMSRQADYAQKLKATLPSLTQIDALYL